MSGKDELEFVSVGNTDSGAEGATWTPADPVDSSAPKMTAEGGQGALGFIRRYVFAAFGFFPASSAS